MAQSSAWEDDPHVLKPNETGRSALEYLAMTTDYLSIPLYVAAVLSDLLIVHTVLKYRRLKTRTNMYLVNFAVFHVLYIVSTPLFYLILDLFSDGTLEVGLFCLWTRVENFAMALAITCIAAFGVDAYAEAVQPSWFPKYAQRTQYVLGFFYCAHGLVYAVAGGICLRQGFTNYFAFYFLTIQYLLTVILVLQLGLRNKASRVMGGKEWVLGVSVTTVLCWLPLYVCYTLIGVFQGVPDVEQVLWYVAFLPEYLAYSCSLIVVGKLWRGNEQFRVAFKKCFRREVPFSEYEELFVSESTVAR